MSSHGAAKNVKSRGGFPSSFRTSPPDVAFAANRWPHMGNCSSDAQPTLAQRLRHLLSSAGGRLGCHRDDLSRGCPLCSDVSRRIPRGRNDFPQPRVSERTGSGAKFLKSAGTGSHMHAAFTAAPAPHNRRRVSCKPFGKCSENVRNWGAPLPLGR